MDVTAPRPAAVSAPAGDTSVPSPVHEAPAAADVPPHAQTAASDSADAPEKDTSQMPGPVAVPRSEQEKKGVTPNTAPAGIIVGTVFGMVALSAIAIAIYVRG